MIAKFERLIRVAKTLAEAIREREPGIGKVERRPQPRNRHAEVGLKIEYSPSMDGDPDPGEVIWTWVPYQEDPTKGKDRPVVVIGRLGEDLAAVALTSKNKRRDDYVAVGSGSWDPRGRPSYAKVDRVLLIDPDDMRREGAILDRVRFDQVAARVGQFHHIRE